MTPKTITDEMRDELPRTDSTWLRSMPRAYQRAYRAGLSLDYDEEGQLRMGCTTTKHLDDHTLGWRHGLMDSE